jgi:hypothetical protein
MNRKTLPAQLKLKRTQMEQYVAGLHGLAQLDSLDKDAYRRVADLTDKFLAAWAREESRALERTEFDRLAGEYFAVKRQIRAQRAGN